MKITCNSCGSKYTIADAKVQGKKVKVRCKGCKESILVDGTKIGSDSSEESSPSSEGAKLQSETATATPKDLPSNDPAPTASRAAEKPDTGTPRKSNKEAPAPNLWSVNITDDDSRELKVEELVQGWKDGLITPDAYVWRDGMGDWKPILEVGELKHLLGAPPEKKSPNTSSESAGKGPTDLFGSKASDGDVTKGSALGGGAKPTGARNDSSVLFSLDSITGPDAKSKARTGGDDIFSGLGSSGGSLGTNSDLLTAPAKDPPRAPAGARPQGTGTKKSESSGKGALIGAILAAALIIAGALFFLKGEDTPANSEADAKLAAVEAKASEALKKAENAKNQAEADRQKMEADLKKAREEAKKKGEDPEAAADAKKAELDGKKDDSKKKEGSTASTSGSSASKGAKSSASSATPAPSEPEPFNVSAAKAALSAAASRAASCKKPEGPTGSGKVQVTFSTSGRVTSSTIISGPFGGSAVGGCVASTFRRARIPKFSGSPKTVKKSFKIR